MAAPAYKRLPAQLIAKPIEGLGIPGSAASALLGLGNKGIEALTGYKDVLPSRFPLGGGISVPTVEDIQHYVTEPILGKENLEPGSFPERAYERFGRSIPAIAATGGAALLPALGAGAVGSAAGQAAEDIGLPAAAQLGVDILASGNFNKILQKMGSRGIPVNTLATMADSAKNKFYEIERELGPKITLNAHPVEDKLIDIMQKASKDTTLSDIQRSKLLRDIGEYSTDILGGNTTASQLFKRRTELNNIIANASDKNSRNYYEAIRKPIVELMEKQKNIHPEWYNAYKSGDNIYRAQNFSENFISGLKDYPKIASTLKNPLAYGVASLGPALYFTKDPITLLATSGGITGGASAIKKGSEIFLQASKEMLERNFPAAARTYSALNKEADKYSSIQQKVKNKKEEKLKKATAHLVPV
jgi:hypothetical protein